MAYMVAGKATLLWIVCSCGDVECQLLFIERCVFLPCCYDQEGLVAHTYVIIIMDYCPLWTRPNGNDLHGLQKQNVEGNCRGKTKVIFWIQFR